MALPLKAARDPYVWLRLEELKRDPCDQKSINDLALALDKLGYRRKAADGLYRFVRACGEPLTAKAVHVHPGPGIRRSSPEHAKAQGRNKTTV